MMHLLATADPDPESLKSWLSVVAYLLGIGLLVKKMFFDKIPQPMMTQEAQEHVPRGSYESHCKINREEHARIESKFEKEVRDVGARHNELFGEVREMKGSLETNGARLLHMDQKIDRLLERRTAVL